MVTVRVCVGLDYHDQEVWLCILDPEGRVLFHGPCRNDWRAIDACARRFGVELWGAIESCTGAADLAEELVQQAGWTMHLAHPGYVARMKQNPDKTDFHDCQLLADLLRVGYLSRVWLAPELVREFRRLVRYRQQLVNERRNAKLRIGALLREQRCRPTGDWARWTKAWLYWLTHQAELSEQGRFIVDQLLAALTRLHTEIGEVEHRLEKLSATDAVVQRLLKEEGIGPVTAWTLRAEIGRFDRFRSGKQLSRFCGLSPRNASSGQRQADAGLVKAANRQLRAVLIEAAHRLARHTPRWRALRQRLRAAGKPGSVAAAAVANRWVRALYHRLQGLAA